MAALIVEKTAQNTGALEYSGTLQAKAKGTKTGRRTSTQRLLQKTNYKPDTLENTTSAQVG